MWEILEEGCMEVKKTQAKRDGSCTASFDIRVTAIRLLHGMLSALVRYIVGEQCVSKVIRF